jgi:hypothetical protein
VRGFQICSVWELVSTTPRYVPRGLVEVGGAGVINVKDACGTGTDDLKNIVLHGVPGESFRETRSGISSEKSIDGRRGGIYINGTAGRQIPNHFAAVVYDLNQVQITRIRKRSCQGRSFHEICSGSNRSICLCRHDCSRVPNILLQLPQSEVYASAVRQKWEDEIRWPPIRQAHHAPYRSRWLHR